jgi:DNA polymerase-3 subunit alpha
MVMEVRNRGDRQQIVKLEDGHGVIEVLFFNDAAAEFAHLLTRDRPLLIQGSLNEDRFNGGLNFRAKQAWDFDLFFARYARHAQLSVDMGAADVNSLNDILRAHRNGPVALRWDLHLADGTRGGVDQAGTQGIALDRATAEQLRAQPGVRRLRFRFDTPWD